MDKKTRIAVFVSGGGTNLQAIIDAEKSGIIKSGKTELVISDNPEAYALERAKANGIKTAVVLKNNGQWTAPTIISPAAIWAFPSSKSSRMPALN